MRINPQALARLRAAPLSGDGLARIFESILAGNPRPELVAIMSLSLDYQDKADVVQDGDLIPVISISLRPATVIQDVRSSVAVHPDAVPHE